MFMMKRNCSKEQTNKENKITIIYLDIPKLFFVQKQKPVIEKFREYRSKIGIGDQVKTDRTTITCHNSQ